MLSNFLSYGGMIATGLAFFIVPALRLKSGWTPLAAGALLWAVAVALKFAWAIPVNIHVYTGLRETLGTGAGDVLFWAYVGALTGVFECGLIYLAVRFVPWLRRFGSNRALALGFGFGAVEALLIGLGAMVPTLMHLYAPGSISPEVAAYIKPLDWALMPAGTVERIGTVFVHGFTTYLIFYAVRMRQPVWFWAAFAFKSAIDMVAAWGQLGLGLGSAANIWMLEAIVVVFAAVSIWGILIFRKRWAAADAAENAA